MPLGNHFIEGLAQDTEFVLRLDIHPLGQVAPRYRPAGGNQLTHRAGYASGDGNRSNGSAGQAAQKQHQNHSFGSGLHIVGHLGCFSQVLVGHHQDFIVQHCVKFCSQVHELRQVSSKISLKGNHLCREGLGLAEQIFQLCCPGLFLRGKTKVFEPVKLLPEVVSIFVEVLLVFLFGSLQVTPQPGAHLGYIGLHALRFL